MLHFQEDRIWQTNDVIIGDKVLLRKCLRKTTVATAVTIGPGSDMILLLIAFHFYLRIHKIITSVLKQ